MADTVTVANVPGVVAALEAGDESILAALEPVVVRWLLMRAAALARYPAQPAGLRYRRTGTLGRTWTATAPAFAARSTGFDARIGNATLYAPFAQGPNQRPAFARIGWRDVETEAKEATPELEASLRQAAAAAEAQINGSTA